MISILIIIIIIIIIIIMILILIIIIIKTMLHAIWIKSWDIIYFILNKH